MQVDSQNKSARNTTQEKFAGNQSTKDGGASSNIKTPVSLKKVKRKTVDSREVYRLIDINL